ncbi:MAG: dihydropteroate synthase [Pseudohongiellaceae bacterium]
MNRVVTLRGGILDLSTPIVMGILNVTPDSFYDGSRLADPASAKFQISLDKAIAAAGRMRLEGAAIIDVGGESTRPGAAPVPLQEELNRVIPVIEAIAERIDVAISVDTSTPQVMREACTAGAVIINDVRALGREGAMEEARDTGAGICLMHMQGNPGTMQESFAYADVVVEVFDFLTSRVKACEAAGIDRQRLLVDPGFGFGKSVQHNFQLLKHLHRFQSLDLPVLVGVSRKSMIGKLLDKPVTERLAGSLAATCFALERGANVIRTHDVAATMDAIAVNCALACDRSGRQTGEKEITTPK